MPVDFFNILTALFSLALLCVGLLMFRRILRDEPALSEREWKLFFGRPREEVLKVSYWLKASLVGLLCFGVVLAESILIAPYGLHWYLVALLFTAYTAVLVARKLFAYRDPKATTNR